MKSKVYFISFFILFLIQCPSLQAQSFKKGNSVITAGYGTLVLGNLALKAISKNTSFEYSSKGPYLAKYEYGLTDFFGGGISFVNFSGCGKYTYISKNDSSQYSASFKWKSFNLMARLNFHFGKFKKFDPYIGAGIGIRSNKYTFTSEEIDFIPPQNFSVPLPVTVEITLGARYYPLPFLGIYSEIGISKALFQFGVVGKF